MGQDTFTPGMLRTRCAIRPFQKRLPIPICCVVCTHQFTLKTGEKRNDERGENRETEPFLPPKNISTIALKNPFCFFPILCILLSRKFLSSLLQTIMSKGKAPVIEKVEFNPHAKLIKDDDQLKEYLALHGHICSEWI